MKMYFSKYLPIEGEIKEGEDYWCSVYGYRKNNPASKNILAGNDKFKPVKLFLCSKDIKVGDEMASYVPVGEPPYTIETGLAISYNAKEDTWEYKSEKDDWNVTCRASFCFKILGEISPLAIFASEGMELTEDDVRASHEYKDGIITKWDRDSILCYKIKCPTCNIYH